MHFRFRQLCISQTTDRRAKRANFGPRGGLGGGSSLFSNCIKTSIQSEMQFTDFHLSLTGCKLHGINYVQETE